MFFSPLFKVCTKILLIFGYLVKKHKGNYVQYVIKNAAQAMGASDNEGVLQVIENAPIMNCPMGMNWLTP